MRDLRPAPVAMYAMDSGTRLACKSDAIIDVGNEACPRYRASSRTDEENGPLRCAIPDPSFSHTSFWD